jgi:hypothetical protein
MTSLILQPSSFLFIEQMPTQDHITHSILEENKNKNKNKNKNHYTHFHRCTALTMSHVTLLHVILVVFSYWNQGSNV